jgi:hypothetical protein
MPTSANTQISGVIVNQYGILISYLDNSGIDRCSHIRCLGGLGPVRADPSPIMRTQRNYGPTTDHARRTQCTSTVNDGHQR